MTTFLEATFSVDYPKAFTALNSENIFVLQSAEAKRAYNSYVASCGHLPSDDWYFDHFDFHEVARASYRFRIETFRGVKYCDSERSAKVKALSLLKELVECGTSQKHLWVKIIDKRDNKEQIVGFTGWLDSQIDLNDEA